jgi:hypothetical protein
MRKGQPGWLEPSVYCFIIAFASLDFEKQLCMGNMSHNVDHVNMAHNVDHTASTTKRAGNNATMMDSEAQSDDKRGRCSNVVSTRSSIGSSGFISYIRLLQSDTRIASSHHHGQGQSHAAAAAASDNKEDLVDKRCNNSGTENQLTRVKRDFSTKHLKRAWAHARMLMGLW